MSLEIAFDTRQLRALCESETKAVRELGQAAAEALKRRLADLRAAESIDDLVASPPLRHDNSMELSISVADNLRLVLRPNHLNPPMLDSLSVDWSLVERVKIARLERDG